MSVNSKVREEKKPVCKYVRTFSDYRLVSDNYRKGGKAFGKGTTNMLGVDHPMCV